MTRQTSGSRRASYLIAAAVLLLLVLAGAAYLAIGAVRGNEADIEEQVPDGPPPEVVSFLVVAQAGPSR